MAPPRSLLWLLLGACLAGPVLAADLETCRPLREQRNALAEAAMREEIALARTMRERVCPALSRRAEAANANASASTNSGSAPDPAGAPDAPPIDYAALLRCREQAERLLEQEHRLLYRNRLGFTYYTATGASLARQADAVARRMEAEGCPAGR